MADLLVGSMGRGLSPSPCSRGSSRSHRRNRLWEDGGQFFFELWIHSDTGALRRAQMLPARRVVAPIVEHHGQVIVRLSEGRAQSQRILKLLRRLLELLQLHLSGSHQELDLGRE